MGLLAKCSAKLAITAASTIYLLLGISMTWGFAAALSSEYHFILPFSVSGLGIAAGIIVALISILGYCAVCSSSRPRCYLAMFTLLTLLVLVGCIAVTAYLVNSAAVLSAAASVERSSSGAAQATQAARDATHALEQALAVTLSATYDLCQANVSVASTSTPSILVVSMSCATAAIEPLARLVTAECLGPTHPVNGTAASLFSACYADETIAWPNATHATTTSPAPAARIATARGLFCQCSGALADASLGYVHGAQALAVLLDIFFSAVVLASTYLMCCAKYGAATSRRAEARALRGRHGAAAQRPRSALVERMRQKYGSTANGGAGDEAAQANAERAESFLASRM